MGKTFDNMITLVKYFFFFSQSNKIDLHWNVVDSVMLNLT